MSKAEKFIQDCTKNCSNIIETINRDKNVAVVYQPWLTPENALRAVEIAKEEVAKKVLDLLQGDQTIAVINVIMYCNSIMGKED